VSYYSRIKNFNDDLNGVIIATDCPENDDEHFEPTSEEVYRAYAKGVKHALDWRNSLKLDN
jgi:hypothetical protein